MMLFILEERHDTKSLKLYNQKCSIVKFSDLFIREIHIEGVGVVVDCGGEGAGAAPVYMPHKNKINEAQKGDINEHKKNKPATNGSFICVCFFIQVFQ